MSKLIASTMTHRTFTLAEALERLSAAGFKSVELLSGGTWVPHFDAANADDALIASTAAIVAASGMGVHCINTSESDLKSIENLAALGQAVGAGFLTIPCGGNPPEGKSRADAIAERAKHSSKAADITERYGLKLAIEAPHKNTLAECSAQIDEYWAAQDKRIFCTFDTAHLTFAGEDILPVAAKYAPRIIHCHLRDAIKGNSLMKYGEGIVDFGAFVETVRAGGYDGCFSMEYPADSNEEAPVLLARSIEYLSKFNI